jgi:hypothetical protein
MSDYNIKQRLNRAVKSAIRILEQPGVGCDIIKLDNHIFHIEAVRKREIRKIRIVLDEITESDLDKVQKFALPEYVTKEIWVKKGRDFNVHEIN